LPYNKLYIYIYMDEVMEALLERAPASVGLQAWCDVAVHRDVVGSGMWTTVVMHKEFD
jgi:hypothetical protein